MEGLKGDNVQRVTNLLLLVVAPLPSVLYCCGGTRHAVTTEASQTAILSKFISHPLVEVNLLFFLNVCVVFWIVSLSQNSTWVSQP